MRIKIHPHSSSRAEQFRLLASCVAINSYPQAFASKTRAAGISRRAAEARRSLSEVVLLAGRRYKMNHGKHDKLTKSLPGLEAADPCSVGSGCGAGSDIGET